MTNIFEYGNAIMKLMTWQYDLNDIYSHLNNVPMSDALLELYAASCNFYNGEEHLEKLQKYKEFPLLYRCIAYSKFHDCEALEQFLYGKSEELLECQANNFEILGKLTIPFEINRRLCILSGNVTAALDKYIETDRFDLIYTHCKNIDEDQCISLINRFFETKEQCLEYHRNCIPYYCSIFSALLYKHNLNKLQFEEELLQNLSFYAGISLPICKLIVIHRKELLDILHVEEYMLIYLMSDLDVSPDLFSSHFSSIMYEKYSKHCRRFLIEPLEIKDRKVFEYSEDLVFYHLERDRFYPLLVNYVTEKVKVNPYTGLHFIRPFNMVVREKKEIRTCLQQIMDLM